MIEIYATPGARLYIGRRGEHLARAVVFDTTGWVETYGPGEVSLLHQRPGDEAPYPCVIEVAGQTARWVVTASDTALAGLGGRCELQYRVGGAVVKSEVWTTIVSDALGEPSDTPPEPQQAWVDKVLEAGTDAVAAADQAARDAETTGADRAAVEAHSRMVQEAAREAARDAAAAAESAGQAVTSGQLAEAAMAAAEASEAAAAASERNADASADNAASAAMQAAMHAENAAAYAAAAEQSAGLYDAVREELDGLKDKVGGYGLAVVDGQLCAIINT